MLKAVERVFIWQLWTFLEPLEIAYMSNKTKFMLVRESNSNLRYGAVGGSLAGYLWVALPHGLKVRQFDCISLDDEKQGLANDLGPKGHSEKKHSGHCLCRFL